MDYIALAQQIILDYLLILRLNCSFFWFCMGSSVFLPSVPSCYWKSQLWSILWLNYPRDFNFFIEMCYHIKKSVILWYVELLKLLCYEKKSLFRTVNCLNKKMEESDNEGWSDFNYGKSENRGIGQTKNIFSSS